MKTLILTLLAATMFFSGTSFTAVQEQTNVTFEEPFEFVTDDGCGAFHVSGTVTVRYTDQGMELSSYEGTAVSLATGESSALHVRALTTNSPRSFTAIINGVFPGVMQFHYQLHMNLQNGSVNFQSNDFSHCLN